MALKVFRERELITPSEREVLIQLALGRDYTNIARHSGRSFQTVKNQIHYLYEKVERFAGTRPTYPNIVIFAMFGRFLTEVEVRHLIESGEFHAWRMGDGK